MISDEERYDIAPIRFEHHFATDVLLELKACRNHGTGEARPGRALIARRVGCSVKTVERVVAALEGVGVLEVEAREGRTNVYRFPMHPGRECRDADGAT